MNEHKDISMRVAVEAILQQIEKSRNRAISIAAKEKMLEGVKEFLLAKPEDPQLLADKKRLEKEIKELKPLQTAFEKFFNILKKELDKKTLTA